MNKHKIQKGLRYTLIPAAVLPFVLFEKAALLSVGNPLWWLVGYPLAVALIFAALSEKGPTKRVRSVVAKSEGAETCEDTSFEAEQRHRLAMFNDPAYTDLAGNDFHRHN